MLLCFSASQVTRQTNELTTAFEKQSHHILGLLAELQGKESALLSQGEELMKCKQELDVLKEEENNAAKLSVTTEVTQRDEKFAEKSELQLEQDKEPVVTLHSANLNVQNETIQPIVEECDAKICPPVCDEDESGAVTSGQQPEMALDMKRSADSPRDSVCEVEEDQSSRHGERVEACPELHVLRQENQLLKQRIKDFTNMDTRDQTSQTDGENQDDTENTACASCLEDLKGVATDQLLQINLKTSDDDGEERSRMSDERKLEEMSEIQINQLQQQVMDVNSALLFCKVLLFFP